MKFTSCFLHRKDIFTFFVFVIILAVVSCAFSGIVDLSVSRYNGYIIVLDAGHGGRDGGSVGVNGTIEKEINLKYTLALKEKLVAEGYRVVLTRSTDDGLYSATASNKKLSDMKARFKIIQKANPNLVISIHMNSFSDASVSGAMTYFRADDEASQTCADYIQNTFHTYCDAPNKDSKEGDYYILNCSYYTAILIECGFLSNAEEEARLNTSEYMDLFTTSVFYGITLYFGNTNISV